MYLLDRLGSLAMSTSCSFRLRRLAGYFLSALHHHQEATLSNASLDLHISKATIVRFAQAAGFDGFPSFWNCLVNDYGFWSNYERAALRLPAPSSSAPAGLKALTGQLGCRSHLFIYGRSLYTSLLESLWTMLQNQGQHVYRMDGWEVEPLFSALRDYEEDALVLIIEPELTLQDFLPLCLAGEPLSWQVLSCTIPKVYLGPGRAQSGIEVFGNFDPRPGSYPENSRQLLESTWAMMETIRKEDAI